MPEYVSKILYFDNFTAKMPTSKDRYKGRPNRADYYILPVKIRTEVLKWFNKRVFTTLLNMKNSIKNALSLTELQILH